jgi:pimeloyl-ACP methyl ester carboxylesterase
MTGRVEVQPFRPVLGPRALQSLRLRLADSHLTDMGDDWRQGVPSSWLRELLDDWRSFAASALQDRLDAMTHVLANVDGQSLHAVVVQGAQPGATPLLLTHGWPGSFLEHTLVAPLLNDAFTVVIPSLPGFGFSGPPPVEGLASRSVAGQLHRLMTDGLGHESFVAHGSDLGAGVTAWLARDHPDVVKAIHLATPGLAPAPEPLTPEERAFAAEVETWTADEGGYAHEHATKPFTLGAALHDSPAGLAAWIGEKVLSWSSTRADGTPAFDRELLLATLTLYWTTGTITSSLLPYWAARHNPESALPVDDPSPIPTAISIFGGEQVPFPKPPRALAERYYNVSEWREHASGGHFPTVAEPELLARTLREVLLPAARQT